MADISFCQESKPKRDNVAAYILQTECYVLISEHSFSVYLVLYITFSNTKLFQGVGRRAKQSVFHILFHNICWTSLFKHYFRSVEFSGRLAFLKMTLGTVLLCRLSSYACFVSWKYPVSNTPYPILTAGVNPAVKALCWPREAGNTFSNQDIKWMTVDHLERDKDGELENSSNHQQ